MQSQPNEGVTPEQGTLGGVISLLKMTKAQCGAAVAIAALRDADGNFSVTVFPSLSADSSAAKPLKKLINQIWEDPLLVEDRPIVREARVPKGLCPGLSRQTHMAVVALGRIASAEPAGVLCVAGPSKGQYDQGQVDTLHTMAVRLTSYLRARGMITEDSIDDTLPVQREAPEVAWYEDEESHVTLLPKKPLQEAPVTEAEASTTPGAPLDSANIVVARPAPAVRTRAVPAIEALGAPTTEKSSAPGAAPTSRTFVERSVPENVPATSEAIDSLFSPDPTTGLVALPALLGGLGKALVRLPLTGGTVAVFLVQLSASTTELVPVSDDLVATVAGVLQAHVRTDDLVGRIDGTTLAVVISLGARACAPSVIERRLVDALSTEVDTSAVVAVRSAAVADADGVPVGPEELLRRASLGMDDPW